MDDQQSQAFESQMSRSDDVRQMLLAQAEWISQIGEACAGMESWQSPTEKGPALASPIAITSTLSSTSTSAHAARRGRRLQWCVGIASVAAAALMMFAMRPPRLHQSTDSTLPRVAALTEMDSQDQQQLARAWATSRTNLIESETMSNLASPSIEMIDEANAPMPTWLAVGVAHLLDASPAVLGTEDQNHDQS